MSRKGARAVRTSVGVRPPVSTAVATMSCNPVMIHVQFKGDPLLVPDAEPLYSFSFKGTVTARPLFY